MPSKQRYLAGSELKRMLVLYYSRTGNTEKMAKAITEGAEAKGVHVETNYYVAAEELASYDAIAVGAPTYHHDMTINMKKIFEEAAEKKLNLENKLGAAFGSYGWSGEAPRLVLEILKNKFGMKILETSLLIRYEPDKAGLEKCRIFGQEIAERLMD